MFLYFLDKIKSNSTFKFIQELKEGEQWEYYLSKKK